MRNVLAVLREAGAGPEHVTRLGIHLVGDADPLSGPQRSGQRCGGERTSGDRTGPPSPCCGSWGPGRPGH